MATPLSIVIFGASGDLTARKLIPALFHLFAKKRLPAGAKVIGVARTDYSDTAFRDQLKPKVKEAAKDFWDDATWDRFAEHLHYVPADAATPGGCKPLADWLDRHEGQAGGARLYYLSVAPELYAGIVTNLGEAGMAREDGDKFRRVIIEKPFGTDLASARALNKTCHAHFRESQLFRIDHYLGKETVQNILIFRFANTLFEPLWNSQYIDHVQITVEESVLVGKRGNYYDKSGVLRDMIQSHMLQVMTMVAMDAPSRYNADSLRNEKMKVLDAVTLVPTERGGRPNSPRGPKPSAPTPVGDANACDAVAAGQYAGYLKEPGVKPDSKTPTYAAVKLYVDNWRWQGVPFYLRSGKGLPRRYSEVMIQFYCPPHLMFPLPKGETLQCNRLTLRIQPNEGIRINFQSKVPDRQEVTLKPADLAFDYREAYGGGELPEAYEILLLDAVQGDATLFMRSDEIERAWEIMDPVIAATESADSPQPQEYAVGSHGPACADELLARDGRAWQNS